MNGIHNVSDTSMRARALGKTFDLTLSMSDDLERGLRELGLTKVRATLLMQLQHSGPITQRELSQLLQVTPRNVTTLLDALQKKGLVVRRPHTTDRRATIVELSEAGSALTERLTAESVTFADSLFGGVTKDDLAGYLRTVEHMLAHLHEIAPS